MTKLIKRYRVLLRLCELGEHDVCPRDLEYLTCTCDCHREVA